MYDHTEYLAEAGRTNPADIGHVGWMLDKLDQYAKSGGKEGVGDFLQGIILGDLSRATGHADDSNKKYIVLYARYCYNQMPSNLTMLGQPVLSALRDFFFDKKNPLTRAQVQRAASAFSAALKKIREA